MYLAIAGTVSAATASVACAVLLHQELLSVALVLMCSQQLAVQVMLHRLRGAIRAAAATGQLPQQRGAS
ncbi:hypothetical protein ACFC26_14775 [Kitasatospora purpeofusca]|uniref:hypothetical protein n=1 Tax=Kitasatospora purpeofusca TaxID=67352 RepID=UPI0035E02E5E